MYSVVLKDRNGCHITDWYDVETLTSAKAKAVDLLSDEWAASAETTHEALGTEKVEVLNEAGECVWDEFAESKGDVSGM